jgi:hypothetical protein
MLSRLNRSQSLISTCLFVLAALIWHENVDAASLQLSWVDNSQNEDGFDIERKTGNGGAFLALATIPANQSSYTDTNLSDGTTYCYRVRAFNNVGGSGFSNEACATTPASALTQPLSTTNTISTNIANGATLSGSSVVWTAVPSGVPVRVEFFIDGTLGTTELYAPYQFNGDPEGVLNTNTLANGSHQLKVRAIYADGSIAERTVAVTVSNTSSTPTPSPSVNTISTNIANGATLSGSSVIWTAVPSGVPVQVEFFIDSTLGTTEFYAPYQFNGDPSGVLNTKTLANGSHQLKVRATYTDGSIAERTIVVTVSNTSTPTANTISTNIANGAVLSGSSVIWTAVPSGVPVRIEFFIDGTLKGTEFYAPYQFNGDPAGTLNTKSLANGSYQLKVRATYADSSIAERTVVVTVSNT